MGDLTPLPEAEQRRRERAAMHARRRAIRSQKWTDGKDRRLRMLRSFKSAVRKGLTLAISVVGATMVGYGVWMIYPPAGFVTGGITVWVLQWTNGEREEGGR